MKRIVTAVLLLGLGGGGALAEVEFRGALCVITANAACASFGWAPGDCVLMRYSPPGLGNNGVATEISLFGQSFADNYSLASGSLIGTTFKPVVALHVGRTGYSFSSKMRITSQSPSPLQATSKSVTFTGGITNFNDSTSCTIGFRASGSLRP